LKYKQDKEVGHLLGRIMADAVKTSDRFQDIDLLVPVPLHPRKERERGYNQSRILAMGFQEVLPLPVPEHALIRLVRTPSQTRRGRMDRWQNVKEAFQVKDAGLFRDKHVLLVDDVVTTGATIEACAAAMAGIPGIRISLFAAACA
jgi:ComF family protein